MTLLEMLHVEGRTESLPPASARPLTTADNSTLPLPTRIAVIGNYLPRQCGIATFTTDLCMAIASEYGSARLFAIPVNDPESSYEYPDRVRMEIEQEDCASYERAAEFLNFNGNDLVCLQHEYGIFGGPAGSHILSLLRRLKMPLVTTLHTVLREPDLNQRTVLEEIAHLSDRLIVMSELASTLLQNVYGVPREKIELIPHGVPDLSFTDPNYFKDLFNTQGKSVLLTFGLLSPNKGIENVIRALPSILAKHKNVTYIVSGATHPHIRKREGERYREELQKLAVESGVSSQVIFNNRFVSAEELVEHVGSADIYITPYRQEAQIVSGTLAIAMGAGKAIISTPYWHAQELLADGRGILVPFDDPAAIAEATIRLLDNDAERHTMRKRAYLHSRGTTWQRTAQAYMASFQRARAERILRPRPSLQDTLAARATDELPAMDLAHLRHMTDDAGILQHAVFSVPNCQEGYTTDDNARALAVTVLLQESRVFDHEIPANLSRRYLAFLGFAFQSKLGRFRNFLGYDRQWRERIGSEDSHGRALWALGTVLGRSADPGLRGASGQLFEAAFPSTLTFTSPRAWAFSILGMQGYLDWFPGDRIIQGARNLLANQLLDLYERTHSSDWPWFETSLAYSNARLSQALILAGWNSKNRRMIVVGCESLKWLVAEQHRDGGHVFVPIGSGGFFAKGKEKARFDQQPVEACATVAACVEAYRATGENSWLQEAWSAFRWFLGENDLQIPLYDAATGGCRDGLHPDRVNENQGAESTLSFLMALLDMQGVETSSPTHEPGNERLPLTPILLPSTRQKLNSSDQHSRDSDPLLSLFTRHPENPMLSRDNWPYAVNSVFNAGAVRLADGDTLLLCRVEDRRGLSHMTVARSANGVDGWRIDATPTFPAEPREYPEEIWGIEDPRITWVPELDQYAIAYTSFARGGPGVSLALTRDFRSFERYGVIMPPEDKDAALLPRKIGGYWALIHRPMTSLGAHMWISYSPDLRHWGRHKIILEARRGGWWDANKIGLCSPPIETEKGWLTLYHGVRQTASGSIYRIGLALFDLENPEVCLQRGHSWVFGPEAAYERGGDVKDVVFPCGQTVGADGDTIHFYYGAGDSCVALAMGSVRELLSWLEANSSAGDVTT